MKSLILITQTFPYGKGEEFLEAEIPYLAEGFDQVYLFPRSCAEGTRPLPNNCILEDHLLSKSSRSLLMKMQIAIRSLLRKDFWRAIVRDWRTLKHLLLVLSVANEQAKTLLYYLEKNPMTSPVLYSYWCDESALALAILKKKIPAVKIVTRAHGVDLYRERNSFNSSWMKGELLRSFDRILTVSFHGKQTISQYYPHLQNLEVSYLGSKEPLGLTIPNVNQHLVFGGAQNQILNHVRYTPSYSPNNLSIVSCSYLVPLKRISLWIEALSLLASKRPNDTFYWTHIGDGPIRESLEKQAKEQLPGNVIFSFFGHLSNENVLDFYQTHAIDLFVSLSETEAVPVSMMEAQSCGIPILATAVGGVPEIVNATNGFLLPANPTCSQVIEPLLALEGLHEKSLQSRRNWELSFSDKSNYQKFVQNQLLREEKASDAEEGKNQPFFHRLYRT